MAIYGSNDEDPPFKYSCQIMILVSANNSDIFHSLQIKLFLEIAFSIAVIYGCSLRTCCVVVCMTQILHLAAWRPELESPTQGPAKTRQPRDTELLVLSSYSQCRSSNIQNRGQSHTWGHRLVMDCSHGLTAPALLLGKACNDKR